ncbi:Pectin degradation repressor protein KdgR [compost metagenome]
MRRHGYARDNEELELGVRCIAAGIFDDTGKLVAGLSISAPAERLQDDWIKALVDTAASISEALGFEPSVSTGFNGLGMAAEALRP